MSAPEFSNPSTVAAPVGAYSHVALVKAGSDILYLSGQVGIRPDGTLPASFEEQADATFANLVAILKANGMTPANLVKMNWYVVAGQPVAAARTARLKHFGEIKPASTFIFVPQLVEPKYLIEVEGVAAR